MKDFLYLILNILIMYIFLNIGDTMVGTPWFQVRKNLKDSTQTHAHSKYFQVRNKNSHIDGKEEGCINRNNPYNVLDSNLKRNIRERSQKKWVLQGY